MGEYLSLPHQIPSCLETSWSQCRRAAIQGHFRSLGILARSASRRPRVDRSGTPPLHYIIAHHADTRTISFTLLSSLLMQKLSSSRIWRFRSSFCSILSAGLGSVPSGLSLVRLMLTQAGGRLTGRPLLRRRNVSGLCQLGGVLCTKCSEVSSGGIL